MTVASSKSCGNPVAVLCSSRFKVGRDGLAAGWSEACSADEAADRLGVCRKTVYRMVRKHRLAGLKFAHTWRIHIPSRELFPSAA